MAAQNFQYTKISELPSTNTATDDSVMVINVGNETKKISYGILKGLITSAVSQAVAQLTNRVSNLETSVSSLNTRMGTAESSIADLQGTVNNIITAGFNLIGIDSASTNEEKE